MKYFILLIDIADNYGSALILSPEQSCAGRSNEWSNPRRTRTKKAVGEIVSEAC